MSFYEAASFTGEEKFGLWTIFQSCMHVSWIQHCFLLLLTSKINTTHTKKFSSFSNHPCSLFIFLSLSLCTDTHINGVDMVVRHASYVNNVQSGAGSVWAETEKPAQDKSAIYWETERRVPASPVRNINTVMWCRYSFLWFKAIILTVNSLLHGKTIFWLLD